MTVSNRPGGQGAEHLRCPRRRPSGGDESLRSHRSKPKSHDDEPDHDNLDDDDATQVTSNTNPRQAEFKLRGDLEGKNERTTVSTCHSTHHDSATFHHDPTEVTTGSPPPEESRKLHRVREIAISHQDPEEPLSRDTFASTSPLPLLTEERVRSFITDYYEDFDSIFRNHHDGDKQKQRTCFEAFFDQYYTADILWIRSSGNPIGRKDLTGLLTDNIECDRAILVSIDHIALLAGGLAATVVYTADLLFSYKGSPQSDRCVLSSVLTFQGVEPKIAHIHWSVGQPIPKASRWAT